MAAAGGPGIKLSDVFPVSVDRIVPVGDSTPITAIPLIVLVIVRVTTPFTVTALPVTVPFVVVTVTDVPSAMRLSLAS